MSKSNQPTSPDSGKTKQQLLDELNLLRHQLSELERAASGVEKNATNDDSQNALTEIKRNEALLNEILNISADAIISIDENQCITRFNQGAQQTFGYRAQELVGEALEILLPEQFRRSHGKHVQDFGGGQVASRMMNQRRDIVGLRKDGTTFPARASISRIERDGKTTLSVILRDVSDIRVAEQAARQSQSELAHVTRIGLLGEISASLAHELNQPLGAILSNAQVLKRQIDATPTRLDGADEVISDVIYDVRRAGAVVQRLRALSKPGKQKTEAVDLNQIVTETKDLLSSEIVIRQVSLTMELAPGLPAASCDRIQLQQILLNFLTNAFDAMDGLEPAGRHLLIRTRQAGTTAVEVCVKDSGVGFKGESDQRLFEPFYTTKESGMGMGLAISRTILQAHGGRLWAENNRGPGAAFYFTVPADSATDATA
jgi:two-component system sensor kinase FixL